MRYIRSKDDSQQIAVEMTDEMHQLVWGRLWLSTHPHPVPIIEVEDPLAWITEQRLLPPGGLNA